MLRGRSVTVHRYETDRYGDRVEVSSHQIHRTAFAPRPNEMGRGSEEVTDRANQVIADAELYVPYASDIESTDVVELDDGSRWEVSGRPERWTGAFSTGWLPGTVVPLRRMTG